MSIIFRWLEHINTIVGLLAERWLGGYALTCCTAAEIKTSDLNDIKYVLL